MIFHGSCDSKCNGCRGPSAFDCINCVPNAHVNDFGACECDEHYLGDDCSICTLFSEFHGKCHAKCYGGCTGATQYDCIACVDNATKNENGACVCDMFWDGEDCSLYVYYKSECDARCYGCNGPSNYECVACAENASFNIYRACVCDSGWSGTACNIEAPTDGCDPICDQCTGPTTFDCVNCGRNAQKNIYGECECVPFYQG